MELITNIALLGVLSIIIYQDLRLRMISWVLLPILFFLGIYTGMAGNGRDYLVEVLLINFMILGAQLLLLITYFSITRRRLVNLTGRYLGWGDILFLVAAMTLFSPVNFILYYTISLVVILAASALYKVLLKPVKFTLPLAGGLALTLMILVISQMFHGPWFYEDALVINYLSL